MIPTTLVSTLTLSTLLLVFLVSPTWSYSRGAPDTACTSMIPGHGKDPQDPSLTPPASLTITKTLVTPGGTLEFSIDAIPGSAFKGFVVQVRNRKDMKSMVGSFVISGDDAIYMTCNNGIHNSITHRRSEDKTRMKALWRAPVDFEGDVVFRYTVLENYDVYWINIDSSPIRVTRDLSVQDSLPNITSFQNPPPSVKPVQNSPSTVAPIQNSPPTVTVAPIQNSPPTVTVAPIQNSSPTVAPTQNSSPTVAPIQNSSPSVDPPPIVTSKLDLIPLQTPPNFLIPQPASSTKKIFPAAETEAKEEEIFTPVYISSTTTLRTTTTTTTTPRPPLAVRDGVLIRTDPDDDIYHGCDQSDDDGAMKKGCIGMPSGCVATRLCSAVATWWFDRGYHFRMKGRSNGFLSFGLSRDAEMGEDLTTNCIYNVQNGQVDIQAGYNEGKSHNEPILGGANVTGILRGGERSFEDGWISCKWTRVEEIRIKNQWWRLDSDRYHILLAAGPMNSGLLGYHSTTKTRAGEAKGLGEVGVVASKSRLPILLHGSFMIAAWICCASLGMMIARYYKQTWTNSRCCGLDQWFILHRSFMILTWCLTVAGFALIFWHKGGWTDIPYWVNPHAVLGCVTTGLCFIQPFIALLRCSPNHRQRGWFNWIHWFVGNAAHILGVVTILFAVDLPSADLPKPETDWLLVGFVVFHGLSHVVMSCVACVADKKSAKTGAFPGVAMRPMGSRANPYQSYPDYEEVRRDAPGSAGRIFILFLYGFVNVAFTTILILILVLASFRDWVAELMQGPSYFL